MPANTDLGELLLLMLNPYLNAQLPQTSLTITGVDIYCRNPNPVAAPHPAPAPTVAEISYELDGPYAQDWNFQKPAAKGWDGCPHLHQISDYRREQPYFLGRRLSSGRLWRRDGRIENRRDGLRKSRRGRPATARRAHLSVRRRNIMATAPGDDRRRTGTVVKYSTLRLDLNEIQGDLLSGMQKHAELFLFFKIADAARFKDLAREYVVSRLTNGRMVRERDGSVEARRHRGGSGQMPWLGVNLGFTRDGLMRLLGPNRPRMDPAFERGADDPETIAALNDPPPSKWLRNFLSDRIDGVFLIAGPDKFFVTSHGNTLRGRLGSAMKTVYSEIDTVRPGHERGHEHFGFSDGISQPGIRGLTPLSRPSAAPEQGLPGQDLIWAGEFVLGYPGQDPRDPIPARSRRCRRRGRRMAPTWCSGASSSACPN
jgi:hypothetical protein